MVWWRGYPGAASPGGPGDLPPSTFEQAFSLQPHSQILSRSQAGRVDFADTDPVPAASLSRCASGRFGMEPLRGLWVWDIPVPRAGAPWLSTHAPAEAHSAKGRVSSGLSRGGRCGWGIVASGWDVFLGEVACAIVRDGRGLAVSRAEKRLRDSPRGLKPAARLDVGIDSSSGESPSRDAGLSI